MPTYKGVEVWLEDRERRKLSHEHVAIDLVDDSPVTLKAKTSMFRDELYTVHCLSPISVFCDVFVTVRSRVRLCAARFHIEKSFSISDNALGSSVGHTQDRYKETGLRTPKRAFQHGKLGTVEIEVRRTGPIIKGESIDCAADEDGQDMAVFSMIDDFDRPPWLLFVFDISAKGPSLLTAAPGAQKVMKQGPHKGHRRHRAASWSRSSSTGNPSSETPRPCVGQNLPDVPQVSTSLQREYEKEEAEERRLIEILQQRLEAKKTSNMALRQLLGETV